MIRNQIPNSTVNLLVSTLFFKITYAIKAFPLTSWGYPITALSATSLCSLIEFSIGAVPRLCPETITTSSTLPVILKFPSASLKEPSPGK